MLYKGNNNESVNREKLKKVNQGDNRASKNDWRKSVIKEFDG